MEAYTTGRINFSRNTIPDDKSEHEIKELCGKKKRGKVR